MAKNVDEIREEIIKLLNKNFDTDHFAKIDPDEQINYADLGIDSVDMLEISLLLNRKYKLPIRPNNANNPKIFKSINSLSSFVAKNSKS